MIYFPNIYLYPIEEYMGRNDIEEYELIEIIKYHPLYNYTEKNKILELACIYNLEQVKNWIIREGATYCSNCDYQVEDVNDWFL